MTDKHQSIVENRWKEEEEKEEVCYLDLLNKIVERAGIEKDSLKLVQLSRYCGTSANIVILNEDGTNVDSLVAPNSKKPILVSFDDLWAIASNETEIKIALLTAGWPNKLNVFSDKFDDRFYKLIVTALMKDGAEATVFTKESKNYIHTTLLDGIQNLYKKIYYIQKSKNILPSSKSQQITALYQRIHDMNTYNRLLNVKKVLLDRPYTCLEELLIEMTIS